MGEGGGNNWQHFASFCIQHSRALPGLIRNKFRVRALLKMIAFEITKISNLEICLVWVAERMSRKS